MKSKVALKLQHWYLYLQVSFLYLIVLMFENKQVLNSNRAAAFCNRVLFQKRSLGNVLL